MPWFKVDDGFAFHPKAIEAGNAALGLWVRAGAWCGANLTDGALPKHMIGTFGAQARDARRLVEVGLWVETSTGYQFHDWDQMQPTKASVEAERAENRARQKAWRDRQRNGVSNDVRNGVTNEVTNSAPTRPDPTINKKTRPIDSGEFDEWYSRYPRKEAKEAARKAFTKARQKASLEELINGIEQYKRATAGKERQFLALPASWLNAGRWEDEIVEDRRVVNGPWNPGYHQ